MKDVVFKRAGQTAMMVILFSVASSMMGLAQENPAVKQARQFIYKDQPVKAIGILNDAIKANPTDASLLYYLGRTQILLGQNQQAEISFQKGLDLNPKEAINTAGKGHLRMVENNVNEAKQLLEQAISSTKSKNPAVLRAVADAYLANDKFTNEAITALQKAKSDNDPYTFILLGDANVKLGNGGAAVTAYEKAASLDPKDGFPHYKIGVVYFRAKNNAVAEEALIKATTVDPNALLAHKELGEFYYVQKQFPKAVKSHEAYLALLDKSDVKKFDDAEFKHAFYLFANKEYAKANAIFANLIKKPDASVNVYKYYFYSLVKSSNFDEAKNIWAQYTVKAGDSIQASDWVNYAEMLVEQKQDSLAIIAYKTSLDLEKNSEIAEKVAEMLFSAKRYADAADAYEVVKSVRGKLTSRQWFDYGRASYASKRLIKADSAFAELMAVQPTITPPYAWRGRTAAAIDSMNTTFAAKPYFEKVLEIGAANPEKSKADMIQAYEYLGFYFDAKSDFAGAKSMFEKLKAIDPTNLKATEYLKAMSQSQQQKKKKSGTK